MYQALDTKQVNQLHLIRHGWWNREYELTDGVNSYGKLSYKGLSWRNATVITAGNTWIFGFKELFSRSVLITDQNGTLIGETTREILSRKRTLTLRSGFTADFYRPAILSREYIWESAAYGKIMSMRSTVLNLRMTIDIDQTQTPASVIPLLIFLGAHLSISARRRRAAR